MESLQNNIQLMLEFILGPTFYLLYISEILLFMLKILLFTLKVIRDLICCNNES